MDIQKTSLLFSENIIEKFDEKFLFLKEKYVNMKCKVSLVENPPSNFDPEYFFKPDFKGEPYTKTGNLTLLDDQIKFETRKWLNPAVGILIVALLPLSILFFPFLTLPLLIAGFCFVSYAIYTAKKKEKMIIDIKEIKSIIPHKLKKGPLNIKWVAINIITHNKNLWILPIEKLISTGGNEKKVKEILNYFKMKGVSLTQTHKSDKS